SSACARLCMTILHNTIQHLRRIGVRRGWAPTLMAMASISPRSRGYRAMLTNGDTLLLDLSNRMSYNYFFFGGLPNEAVTASLLAKFLKRGGGFVDVGANLGYYTTMASRCVGSDGYV